MKKNRKKILFLGPFPPPHYGSSILCKRYLDFFKNSKKFEMHSIKLNYSKEINDLGTINKEKVFGIFKVRKKLREELSKFKPDLVYFAPATSGLGLVRDFYFSRIIKQFKVHILYHLHSRITLKIRQRRVNELLLKGMLGKEKAIVLGKELVKDVSWVINPKDIFILPNAIDNKISEFDLSKTIEKRSKRKEVRILFVSNMIFSKGWPILLKACKILNKRNITFKCNFIGDWPSKNEKKLFHSFIEKNSLNKKVNHLGALKGDQKDNMIKDSDILIFPTTYELETFGLVIIEAMMYAVPVIANSIASIPSIIKHGQTGYLLRKNSPLELSNYLEQLIKDKKKRKKMGKNGRKRFLGLYEMKNFKSALLNIIWDC